MISQLLSCSKLGLLAGCVFLVSCASEQSVSKLPSPNKVSENPAAQQKYRAAVQDFEMIKADQEPINSQRVEQLYDGGSRNYYGEGYVITKHSQLELNEGVRGFWKGTTITMNRSITGGRPITYSTRAFHADGVIPIY